MTYDSPKQIRDRQNQRNNAWGGARRRSAQPRTPTVITDEEWGRRRAYHILRIHVDGDAGHCDAVVRHAQALVHMAIQRRALEVMRAERRDYWTAMDTARIELLGKEPI